MLDNTDMHILKELTKNSRISFFILLQRNFELSSENSRLAILLINPTAVIY
ncbi:hypothetical protein [Bacillus sp. ISL-7]|uniref:hypothetical protein n=1 Tax=Bacillus sp. ISL-7 TaxID=2819136 RepID=UPI001BE54B8F|nr:hypothetical protein [Bacillus sp. ISL-7]MBT2737846.1 hypothetical protein [Bacillus sp. ISL-7]